MILLQSLPFLRRDYTFCCMMCKKRKYIFHKNIISRVSLPCLVGKVSVKTQ